MQKRNIKVFSKSPKDKTARNNEKPVDEPVDKTVLDLKSFLNNMRNEKQSDFDDSIFFSNAKNNPKPSLDDTMSKVFPNSSRNQKTRDNPFKKLKPS